MILRFSCLAILRALRSSIRSNGFCNSRAKEIADASPKSNCVSRIATLVLLTGFYTLIQSGNSLPNSAITSSVT